MPHLASIGGEVMGKKPAQGEANLDFLPRGKPYGRSQRSAPPSESRGALLLDEVIPYFPEEVAVAVIVATRIGIAGVSENPRQEGIGAELFDFGSNIGGRKRIDLGYGWQPKSRIRSATRVRQTAIG